MIMAPVFDEAIDFTQTDVNYWQYGGHFSMKNNAYCRHILDRPSHIVKLFGHQYEEYF